MSRESLGLLFPVSSEMTSESATSLAVDPRPLSSCGATVEWGGRWTHVNRATVLNTPRRAQKGNGLETPLRRTMKMDVTTDKVDRPIVTMTNTPVQRNQFRCYRWAEKSRQQALADIPTDSLCRPMYHLLGHLSGVPAPGDGYPLDVQLMRTAPFSMTLKDPTPVSRSRNSLMPNISEYRHNFNGILIGTCTRPTHQCHFEWSWVILSDVAKYLMTQSIARSFSDSWASCLPISRYILQTIQDSAIVTMKC